MFNFFNDRYDTIYDSNFHFNLFKDFEGKNILITGANGYIARTIIECLLKFSKNVNIYITSRNFVKIKHDDRINKVYDLSALKDIDLHYIIHTASPTQSKFFINNPVDTINTIYNDLINLLDFAVNKKVLNFCFLSTLEVYGDTNLEKVKEADCGNLDVLNCRNSYPAIKKLCEHLLCAYFHQYGLNSFALRLCQVIGPGFDLNDNRVYADFLRQAICNKEIIINSDGSTTRDYIDVFDVAMGILYTLFNSKTFNVYNLSNPNYFLSIKELAELISEYFNISVSFNKESKKEYLPNFKRTLDNSLICSLGYKNLFNLDSSIKDMCYYARKLYENTK